MNLLCGCLAVVFISRNNLASASWFVMAATMLDFLDGYAARLLKAYSPLGVQLDSLADMVTFGLVPGFMIHKILDNSTDLFLLQNPWLTYLPFLVTVFSALRLAKFNVDERQSEEFIGLPTPACTLFIVSIPLIQEHGFGLIQVFLASPTFLLVVSILLSFLLVAEIPMFSLKFKTFKWEGNQIRYLFLLISLLLVLLLGFLAVPVIITIYIWWSVMQKLFSFRRK